MSDNTASAHLKMDAAPDVRGVNFQSWVLKRTVRCAWIPAARVTTCQCSCSAGFLYMSNFLHQWLTATQYVAPLMANFDTQVGNNSKIHYVDNGE